MKFPCRCSIVRDDDRVEGVVGRGVGSGAGSRGGFTVVLFREAGSAVVIWFVGSVLFFGLFFCFLVEK